MRLLMTAVLMVVFMLGAAAADEYHDAKAGFRVTIPSGWTKQVKAAEGEDLSVDSPRLQETMGTCSVHARLLAGTESASQADIDKQLRGRFTPAYWLETFKETGMADVAVETSGEEVQNARNTYFVVVNYNETGSRIKFKAVLHVVPGRSYNVFCGAFAAGYPQEEADFETFFDSFTPVPADLVVQATPLPAPAYLSHSADFQNIRMFAKETLRGLSAAKWRALRERRQ